MRFEVPYRFVLYAVVAAFVLWLPLAVMDWCGQRQLFFREGSELLSDYWMPRTCVRSGIGLRRTRHSRRLREWRRVDGLRARCVSRSTIGAIRLRRSYR